MLVLFAFQWWNAQQLRQQANQPGVVQQQRPGGQPLGQPPVGPDGGVPPAPQNPDAANGDAQNQDPQSQEPAAPARPQRPREQRELLLGNLRVQADSRDGVLSDIWLPGTYESVEDKRNEVDYRFLHGQPLAGGLVNLTVKEGNTSLIPVGENWEFDAGDGPEPRVRFANEADGLKVTKQVTGSADSNAFVVELEFENTTTDPKTFTYSLEGPSGLDSESQRGGEGTDIYLFYGQRAPRGEVIVTELAATDLTNNAWERQDGVAWVAASNNYFVTILLPGDLGGDMAALKEAGAQIEAAWAQAYPEWSALEELAKAAGRRFDPARVDADLIDDAYLNLRVGLRSQSVTLAAGEKRVDRFTVFCAPRDSELFANYEALNFSGINSYGWFGGLIRLFIWLLDALKGLCFGSYGLAIIALTVLVKLCLHPVSRRSQASMHRFQKRMQKIKPEMDALKERYPDPKDRMKMHQEMQKLWKEHDVNPGQQMGGCLMIFLQFPVWISLYTTLQYAIGLRQASFLYIEDLTLPDHLFSLGSRGTSRTSTFCLCSTLFSRW